MLQALGSGGLARGGALGSRRLQNRFAARSWRRLETINPSNICEWVLIWNDLVNTTTVQDRYTNNCKL